MNVCRPEDLLICAKYFERQRGKSRKGSRMNDELLKKANELKDQIDDLERQIRRLMDDSLQIKVVTWSYHSPHAVSDMILAVSGLVAVKEAILNDTELQLAALKAEYEAL